MLCDGHLWKIDVPLQTGITEGLILRQVFIVAQAELGRRAVTSKHRSNPGALGRAQLGHGPSLSSEMTSSPTPGTFPAKSSRLRSLLRQGVCLG